MKGYRVPVVIFLIILLTAGWLSVGFSLINNQGIKYNEVTTIAEDYYKRGLFQLAAAKYEEALQIEENKEARTMLVKSWATHYSQDEYSYSKYLSALLAAVQHYPDDIAFLQSSIDLYLERNNYIEAFDLLADAKASGIKDESVLKRYDEIKYSYKISPINYIDFKSCLESKYLVLNSTLWGIVDFDGAGIKDLKYTYLSKPNTDGLMLYTDNLGARLIDKAGVVQGKFSKNLERAGLCSEELIAICENGSYAYYNTLGDKLFGDYKEAGTFSNGFAAVNINGKWGIIDKKGQVVIEPTFEDIKLDSQGLYISKSVILAKKDGQYNLYDQDWSMIKDFSCEQADIITKDGVFAFSSDGKWGFADTTGKVIIEPVYENAKSFSNGLAAVCQGGLWGFVNKDGKIVIPCQFLGADYFNEKGSCMVSQYPDTWQILLRNIRAS